MRNVSLRIPTRTNGRSIIGRTASLPTKRAGPAPVPWYMRAGLSALGTVAPPLAEVWAERLFLTPPRHPAPAEEAEALASAHQGAVRVGDQSLTTWTWGHGPTVLLVHGWGGRGGQLHRFVPALVASGHSVVAFDGPGHGHSSGRTSSLVELGRAIQALVAALPSEVVAIIGHSMGGAATAFALHNGLDVARAVFVGTPSSARAMSRNFTDALELKEHVANGMRARIERRLRVSFEDLEMTRLAPGSPTSLLVIHDDGDREVPWSHGARIAELWPGARMHTTTGLGHRRILADAGVIQEAVSFLTAPR